MKTQPTPKEMTEAVISFAEAARVLDRGQAVDLAVYLLLANVHPDLSAMERTVRLRRLMVELLS